HRSR
ncbi:yjhS, partial [Escherichia coli EC1866]